VCPGQKFQHGGLFYDQGDAFLDTLYASNTCDTIIEYTVMGRALTHDVRTVAICEGDQFVYSDGSLYGAGETIFDFLESRRDADCDTLLELKVVAVPNPIREIEGERIICFGTTTELIASDHKLYEWSTGAESQVV